MSKKQDNHKVVIPYIGNFWVPYIGNVIKNFLI